MGPDALLSSAPRPEPSEVPELLLAELRHRVSNNMQMILSFIAHEEAATDVPEVKAALSKVAARVKALAASHDALQRLALTDILDVSELLAKIAAGVVDLHAGRCTLEVKAGPLLLTAQRAMHLGVIVNELITNSCKYAYPAGQSGPIHLSIAQDPAGGGQIVVRDSGVGFSTETLTGDRKKLGLRLIKRLAGHAGIKIEAFNDGGAVARLTFAPGA